MSIQNSDIEARINGLKVILEKKIIFAIIRVKQNAEKWSFMLKMFFMGLNQNVFCSILEFIIFSSNL